jgi:hypothetical protein
MKRLRTIGVVAAISVFATFGVALGQGPPPVPKPGPEHEHLKKDVGRWDAMVEMFEGPGSEPQKSKGVETNTLMAGGLWLVTEFKGDMGGMAFEGHGITGYDPNKKKYVGTWADSMSTGLSTVESTYDAGKKTLTGWIEGPDPSGKTIKMRTVTEWKDDNTRVVTFHMQGPDGKEVMGMRITYKRNLTARSTPEKQ